MQSLMNQTLWIQLYESGYGVPDYGPVPVIPPTDFASAQESTNPTPTTLHTRGHCSAHTAGM